MFVITFKTIRISKPSHAEGSFLSSQESFWRLGTRTTSLNALGRVTFQTSNSGVLILRFRFFLQYLGGITSPSFLVSTIKASKRHSFLFSSQFAISEHSYLYIPYSSDYSSYLHKRDFKDPQETRRSVRILSYISFVLQSSSIFSANRSLIRKLKMGRFERLVKTPALIESFKEKVPHSPGGLGTTLHHRGGGIWPKSRRGRNPHDCLHRRRHDCPHG